MFPEGHEVLDNENIHMIVLSCSDKVENGWKLGGPGFKFQLHHFLA